MSDILDIIRAELCWPLRDAALELTPETTLEGDLKASAVDLICLQFALEEATGLELPDAEFEACGTVGQIVELVARLQGERV